MKKIYYVLNNLLNVERELSNEEIESLKSQNTAIASIDNNCVVILNNNTILCVLRFQRKQINLTEAPIIRISKNNTERIEFSNLKDAYLGLPIANRKYDGPMFGDEFVKNIVRPFYLHLLGKRKTAFGYDWELKNPPSVNISLKKKNDVLMLDKKGFIMASFKDVKEASSITGINYGKISSNLNKYTKKASEFVFMYEEELNEKYKIEHEPVSQYDENGEFIKEYSNVYVASRETGTDWGQILNCINGHRKTANGYQWFYKNDLL